MLIAFNEQTGSLKINLVKILWHFPFVWFVFVFQHGNERGFFQRQQQKQKHDEVFFANELSVRCVLFLFFMATNVDSRFAITKATNSWYKTGQGWAFYVHAINYLTHGLSSNIRFIFLVIFFSYICTRLRLVQILKIKWLKK